MTNEIERESNNSSISQSHLVFPQANDSKSPQELLTSLSKSADEILRGAIALNPATPTEILEDLLNDKSGYVLSCLRKRGYKTRPVFSKPKAIVGNNLVFRDAKTTDAAFIVALRTHDKKSAHISKTSSDIKQQEAWLEKYSNDSEQVYFIIQDKEGERVGTVRLYDIQNDSFCWGSWILKEGAASSYAIESALLVYHFALSLGFEKAHFDVRKGNESVWKFHERFGANKTAETADDFIYSISLEAIEHSLEKYKKYLPNGFSIEY
jgi:RimJ/RimL family protein N-acetyltransferase